MNKHTKHTYKQNLNHLDQPTIFTLTSIPSTAQTIHTIRDILKKTTVQINTDANPGGSGVIIQKEGNTYSVLTAKHVVCEYEIRRSLQQ